MRDSWTSMYIVGRLKPDVTEGLALAETQAVFRQFWNEAENQWARGPSGEEQPGALMAAGRGSHTVRQIYREPLQVLMAMVAVVLLIACANVANLLLARGSARTKEIAVRMSIGARRGRLVRQFLTESAVLAVAGGLLGLLLAVWGTRVIAVMLDAGTNPIVLDVDPDRRVLAFTMLVSLGTGILFGLAPAIQATRLDVTPSLKATATRGGGGRAGLGGRLLVIGQVALCLVLLTGGSLLVRSLINLKGQDTGFRQDDLLLFYLDARGSRIELAQFQDAVLERLRNIPGVRTVAFSTMSPLATDEEARPLRIIGTAGTAPQPRSVVVNRITPDYFQALGIPVLQGRGIGSQDTATAGSVAVVNETMARDYFAGDAIGRVLAIGAKSNVPVTIVGVVRDNRQRNLRQAVPPMAFVPLAQAEESRREVTVSLRIDGDARPVEAFARAAIRATSPDLMMSYARTMRQQVDASLMRERLLATTSAGFVSVALFLAAIGLYGLMSYGVARRVREIGIRIALGATRGMVLRQVLRTTLGLAAIGIAIGLPAAFQATQLVSSFLFGVTVRDSVPYVEAAVVLLAASLLAGYVPARRATRIDPLTAVRSE
jgi:predicted permease